MKTKKAKKDTAIAIVRDLAAWKDMNSYTHLWDYMRKLRVRARRLLGSAK